jgi:hypothetical protein
MQPTHEQQLTASTAGVMTRRFQMSHPENIPKKTEDLAIRRAMDDATETE